MAATYTLGFSLVLILSVVLVSYADPGHVHTKHVIHAPLHIKLIHHHKIIKVPVVFRKHLHHHKHFSHEHVYIPLKEKPKAVYEEADDVGEGFAKGHKPVVEYSSYEGNSGEGGDGGDYGSHEQYQSQIGGGEAGGNGYSSSTHKSDDSYEYDEPQYLGAHSSYQFPGIH